ncbi:MAG: NifU family protein [Candidatus Dormibacteraeota bacterium]|nr:NifU family protein [Candidatus Dormibacteraeota bacterium]
MAILQRKEFDRRLQQTESLINEVEALADEEVKGRAVEAIQALLNLHGEGLERTLELIADSSNQGQALIDELGSDPVVGGLLLLHGVHPLGLEDRVHQALDKVRPYLGSHGGNVQLVGVDEGVVRLRLEGTCHGCASSAVTLKFAVEREIMEAAPDVVAIEVADDSAERPPEGFIPLGQIKPLAPKAASSDWEVVAGVGHLESGSTKVVHVGRSAVLFCSWGETTFAYRDSCPACGASLAGGDLREAILTCSGCQARFDVKLAGRGVGNELHLEPLPLLQTDGEVRLAGAARS